jgi:CRP-like cAMP-binding protein
VRPPSFLPPTARPLADDERGALEDDLTPLVTSSHLFKLLDDAGRKRLIASAWSVALGPGEVLVRQGDDGHAMFLVLEGTVRVEAEGVELALLSRDACVGEVAVLNGGSRTATVTAEDEVLVVAFEAIAIRAVLEDNPRVLRLLEAMVEARARDTVEKIVSS